MSKILMTSQIVGDAPILTTDSWNESDHPRAANGQFGSGGGGAKQKASKSSSGAAKKPTGKERALALYEKKGGNRKDGEKLLADLLRRFNPEKGTLQSALVYNGFCSVAGAESLARQLTGG